MFILVRTLSCKVEGHVYETIDMLGKSHSDILRSLIMDFVKSLSNKSKKDGIPEVHQRTKANEIDTIHKAVDGLKPANIKDDE